MNKDDYKKEFIERIKDAPKDFEIEKVNLSKNDPTLQHVKKLVGGVDPDFVVKQAEKFLNSPPDENFGYKGRKTRTVIKVIESPGRFYGLKWGKWRIGLFIEEEADENV